MLGCQSYSQSHYVQIKAAAAVARSPSGAYFQLFSFVDRAAEILTEPLIVWRAQYMRREHKFCFEPSVEQK